MDNLCKRAFDLTVSAVALLALAPLLGAIALAVKLGSKGPVMYRGLRVGRDGKPFRILKFRTMVADAEELGGTTTGANDPRVTKVGAFLRAYKLDELPQLVNVLRGEMSLVGPRPEVPEYVDLYTEDERFILTVRPGITDLSSLKFMDLQAHVGAEDPDRVFQERVLPEKNRLRLEYVKTRTFGGDLAILWRTILAMLGRRPEGASRWNI